MSKIQTKRPMGRPMGHGPQIAEKPRDFKTSWGRLIRFCRPYLPALVLALIFAVAGTLTTLVGPDQLSRITDLIGEGLGGRMDLEQIVSICLLLVGLYLAGALLTFAQGWMMTSVTQKLSKQMRTSISEKINRMPLKYFDGTTHGDILSRVTNDVDSVSQNLNQSISQLVTAVVMFAGTLLLMFVSNAVMALVAVGSTLIGFFLMSVIMGKSQRYFVRLQQGLGDMNGHIEEIYSGHSIVKAYNGEKEARETFDRINDSLYESNWKSQFFSGLMQPLMGFIGNFGYVAVCIAGAVLVMNGSITFGVIVAFMVYIRLFTQPLAQIAQAATSLQSTAAASERVFDFLNQPELSDESGISRRLETAEGNVSFRNIRFGYDPEKTIIHHFSADIRAGQKVAIVGPTGAGKTTIVNLLMRFYEVNEGQILIDGVPIQELTRENVHDLFCMVLQDTWLFEGTIRENVVYSKQDVSDEEVVRACKAVGMHHFIKTLPHGYDTVLNDKASLSAGQKQLLTIARAMIENAPLLILDEATSSVDTRTEILVQNAMDRLTKGRTSFVIAHRLSTIKNADLILVMKDGDIIESGSHHDLLEQGGFYAELYNSQFEQAS